MSMDDQYDELCTFGNIPYTPAWYYKRFPGFFNVECYKILAKNTKEIPLTPVPEDTPLPENKKRTFEEVEQN